MRKVIYLAGLALALASGLGCQSSCAPHTQTGWRFEVLKPALMVSGPNATAVTSSTSAGLVGIDHNTAMTSLPGPIDASTLLDGRFRHSHSQRIRSSVVGSGLAAGLADCTMTDICERLERIERRLNAPSPSAPITPAQPMPQVPALR